MKVRCPLCKKFVEWENNPFRPFCSERCQLTDLGEWAMERKKIESDPAPESEEDSSKTPRHQGFEDD